MRVKEAVEIIKHIAVGKYLESEKHEAIVTVLGAANGYQLLSRSDMRSICDRLLRENRQLKNTINELQEEKA